MLERNKVEEEFFTALNNHDVIKMRTIFNIVPTVDLAEIANKTEEPSKLTFIFKVVKSELTSDFFTELNDDTQEKLLMVFSDEELVKLLNESYTDDIVDFLEDMPANLISKALVKVPKDKREAVNKLLNFKEDTAASVMTTEFFELHSDMKVKDAMEVIRAKGKQAETIYTLFLVDDKKNLVGIASLDDLIFADPNEKLFDIKEKEFLFTTASTDQEEVAQMFKKYDLHALAVVNKEQKLIGVITVDDVMDVIEKETNEDIALQAGVIPLDDQYKEVGAVRMALKCAPWLIILIVVGFFSSLILSKFQDKIAATAILAAFIPVIMDTGGNSGSQTSSVIVRSLAIREFHTKDFWKILWKEIRTAMLTGAIVAVVAFGIFMAEMSIPNLIEYKTSTGEPATVVQKLIVSAIVSGTLFCSICISKTLGCIIPFLAKKLKADPAIVSSSTVTTIVDITSLLVYFGILSLFVQFIN